MLEIQQYFHGDTDADGLALGQRVDRIFSKWDPIFKRGLKDLRWALHSNHDALQYVRGKYGERNFRNLMGYFVRL